MPRNKVDGKICAKDAKKYCPVGTITTNRVSFGPTKTIKRKTSQLVKAPNRCIRTAPDGRFIDVQCEACTAKQACKCPQNSKVEEERVQAVKVVIGPCPTKKEC